MGKEWGCAHSSGLYLLAHGSDGDLGPPRWVGSGPCPGVVFDSLRAQAGLTDSRSAEWLSTDKSRLPDTAGMRFRLDSNADTAVAARLSTGTRCSQEGSKNV